MPKILVCGRSRIDPERPKGVEGSMGFIRDKINAYQFDSIKK